MRKLVLLLCVVLVVVAPALAIAQEAADGPVATKTTLWGLIAQGGLTMVPLGLLSVAMIALIIYGFINVSESRMLRLELVPQIQDKLGQLDIDGASAICTGSPSLLTNVVQAGLTRIKTGVLDVASMEKAMEEASVEENAAGIRPINYLSIIAQVAPMLGLLGTVSGMIKAFQKIGLGGMGKPELLAADIGEAMVTTATGLIIGIPAMFFYFWLKSRFSGNVARMARVVGNLLHHLEAAVEQGGFAPEATVEVAPAEEDA